MVRKQEGRAERGTTATRTRRYGQFWRRRTRRQGPLADVPDDGQPDSRDRVGDDDRPPPASADDLTVRYRRSPSSCTRRCRAAWRSGGRFAPSTGEGAGPASKCRCGGPRRSATGSRLTRCEADPRRLLSAAAWTIVGSSRRDVCLRGRALGTRPGEQFAVADASRTCCSLGSCVALCVFALPMVVPSSRAAARGFRSTGSQSSTALVGVRHGRQSVARRSGDRARASSPTRAVHDAGIRTR